MRRFDLPEYKGKPCPMCKQHEAITIKVGGHKNESMS